VKNTLQVVIQNNVTISNVTLINTSAVIEHDNVIGELSFISAGSVITKNVSDKT
jgi:UDP-3-O-[3-hydroxymyristoyl] glucosamine N-acyltransferase